MPFQKAVDLSVTESPRIARALNGAIFQQVFLIHCIKETRKIDNQKRSLGCLIAIVTECLCKVIIISIHLEIDFPLEVVKPVFLLPFVIDLNFHVVYIGQKGLSITIKLFIRADSVYINQLFLEF